MGRSLHPVALARRSILLATAVGFIGDPSAAAAATTMTVTLNVTSIVPAPPGTCLLSSIDPPEGVLVSPAFSFAIACTGSDPYFVTLDGATDGPAPGPAGDPMALRSGTAQTFTLTGPADPLNFPERPARRAITAIVQY